VPGKSLRPQWKLAQEKGCRPKTVLNEDGFVLSDLIETRAIQRAANWYRLSIRSPMPSWIG
jgi:hypothetical protein